MNLSFKTLQQVPWGRAAGWLSFLCSIHCITEAFVLPLLPLSGIILHLSKPFEMIILDASLVLAVLNLGLGTREHGNMAPTIVLSLAIVFLGASFFGSHPEENAKISEYGLTLPGILLLTGSQFLNRHLIKRHRNCDHCVPAISPRIASGVGCHESCCES